MPVWFVGQYVSVYAAFLQDQLGPYFHQVSDAMNLPNAYVLGILGFHAEPVAHPFNFVPRYLRLTEAEVEWKKRHPQEETKPYVERN